MLEIYGLDERLQVYRTSDFAVQPDFQGRGIGLAIHKYIKARARADKTGWIILSMDYNVRPI
jgi:GNAT superfamily N-acetyltransferase